VETPLRMTWLGAKGPLHAQGREVTTGHLSAPLHRRRPPDFVPCLGHGEIVAPHVSGRSWVCLLFASRRVGKGATTVKRTTIEHPWPSGKRSCVTSEQAGQRAHSHVYRISNWLNQVVDMYLHPFQMAECEGILQAFVVRRGWLVTEENFVRMTFLHIVGGFEHVMARAGLVEV
jgi:hypothetical protein